MKIVIAGAGEVGTHLANKLSAEEQQDITLMDPDPKRLSGLSNSAELLAVVGDPTDAHDLRDCNVQHADLFISVMPDEPTNILACTLAASIGAPETIARVSNHRYLAPEYTRFFEGLGVTSLIYPEELAAEEINITFQNPWARQYIELFNGNIVLLGVKVRNGSELVGKKLIELPHVERKKFHVVAIKRGTETIIPSGQASIEHGDIVFFTAIGSDIDEVRQLAGKKKVEVKRVVVMGASSIAMRTIAKASRSIEFILFEKEKRRIEEIRDKLPSNVTLYHGDGRDPALLEEVGIRNAQVFMALTENSETNVLACLAAKRYEVFKTIAKEENIDYIPLAERLDIGTIINKKLIAAGYIYRSLLGQDTSTVKCLTIANADVAEIVARRGSPITGKPVKDLALPKGITLGGMVRNGVPHMIDGNTIIEPYDLVVVFCYELAIDKVKALFEE